MKNFINELKESLQISICVEESESEYKAVLIDYYHNNDYSIDIDVVIEYKVSYVIGGCDGEIMQDLNIMSLNILPIVFCNDIELNLLEQTEDEIIEVIKSKLNINIC